MDVTRREVMVLSLAFPELKVTVVGNAAIARHIYLAESELDGQGRVMLSPPLLQHADLRKDVVVAGLRDYLEIWDIEAWKRQQAESEGSVEDVAERLSQQ